MCQRPADFFNHKEYLLGYSAFRVSRIMIPAFKKPPKAERHHDKAYFNTKLAKARIKSEHCIGLLKTRFQYLKEIRVQLNKQRKRMRRLIEYVTCACILHNLLITEPIPEEWETEMQENEGNGLDDNDELNAPVVDDASGGERRNQLLCYLLEIRA